MGFKEGFGCTGVCRVRVSCNGTQGLRCLCWHDVAGGGGGGEGKCRVQEFRIEDLRAEGLGVSERSKTQRLV